MRPIHWLHISDIHLREGNEWSQDVVLNSMCVCISELREAGKEPDFVLVTGDIAFSGKEEEYALAVGFFDELQNASGVPKDRIFCIPGNHDIDRGRQELCFKGAITELRNSSKVDMLLAGGENLETLQARELNYRRFQETHFADQYRNETRDGLGYVGRIVVRGIHVAIVALDSAWLAEGGKDDHGRLLIGERQVIDAIKLATDIEETPHIVLGMAHHPLHLLQEFDRLPVQDRLEQALHFFHCGHLHQPETRIVGPGGSACLTVATGASYLSRQFHNAFSLVKLDLLNCIRNVSVFRFSAQNSKFYREFSSDYDIELTPNSSCGVSELAEAIRLAYPTIESLSYYLAALVLGKKAEFPIPTSGGHAFGSFEVFRDLANGELSHNTVQFIKFKNILQVFLGRQSLSNILSIYGSPILKYGESLIAACNNDTILGERLKEYDMDSRKFANTRPRTMFAHTLDLLRDLAESQDWDQLRERAERCICSENHDVAVQSRRMLALSLAQSESAKDAEEAIYGFKALAESISAEFTDFGHLATLYASSGNTEDAKKALLAGIEKFPRKGSYFFEIGQRIVAATGDRALRTILEDAVRGVR